MSDTKMELLKKQLEEATANRDSHVSEMADSFSQANMDRLNALQKLVAEAKANVERAGTAESAPQEEAADEDMCVVTLIRGGKNDRCVQIPSGTSMQDLLNTLGQTESGWDATGLTFKRRVGPGQTAELTSLAGKFGPGNHEFFVTPKVAGGN